MTSDLAALIARLKDAKEGIRELDCDVYEAVDPNFPKGVATRIEIVPAQPVFATGGYTYAVAPPVTTDISAAVALCERFLPGRYWATEGHWSIEGGARGYGAQIDAGRFPIIIENAATPALALCLAILRAKDAAHD